ncbi:type I DNA topoisomerase [Candidatus Saccharibacteria bacterium]|nr:type I DNA topoisomerase [Candidatus Saccharibacteria bacterium]
MPKNLVIVESPAKANTIKKYLGGDFEVLSSMGHIRSIAKKSKDGGDAIDVKAGFATSYEVDPDKRKTITALKKAASGKQVWLATDEDREGEGIAWHLCEVLKLDPTTTKRIVFHEITKDAIESAVKNPRVLDMDLVQAQQARQILDRIVGFELSPVVWEKVPGGKSAGRVQSPAVRLLVEREREIEAFEGSTSFKVVVIFSVDGADIKAELPSKFDSESKAQVFLESLIGATFTIADVTTSPSTRNPGPPFTTSTLQQEANSRLGFSAKATMASAQKLYQEGRITYMRTDSVKLSSQALGQMEKYIKSEYGPTYHQHRTFKTKSSGAQEAHEAIRPTDFTQQVASGDSYNQKLYQLIRSRALASQMAPAKLEKTTIVINISKNDALLVAKGEIIIFDGFLKVYGANKKVDDILPVVKAGDSLNYATATAKQIFARPPARYSEGSLVKKLEELGIGRPSTYATIIDTIQLRGYVIKGEDEGTPRDTIVLTLQDDELKRTIVQEKTGSDRGKLVPTPSGEVVSDFLTGHFDRVVDYDFTAKAEQEFDLIADGKLQRNKMLEDFYVPFHKLIELSVDIGRGEAAQSREIGADPKTGKPIIARFGRYGPMLQMGLTKDETDKPRFAPMPAGAKIKTVTLEQALEMFKLPRTVGKTKDGQDIMANAGRFGPYIKVDKLFVSIKPLDPQTITIEEALDLYQAKLIEEAEKNIADFGDGVKVLNGRYGPYITDGKKNAKIPKGTKPQSVTHEQAKKILATAPTKTKRRGKKSTK